MAIFWRSFHSDFEPPEWPGVLILIEKCSYVPQLLYVSVLTRKYLWYKKNIY